MNAKLPPVTWVFETETALLKQELLKVARPERVKLPLGSEAGDWVRDALIVRIGPLGSENVPAYVPLMGLKAVAVAPAGDAKAQVVLPVTV